ncbi:MAG TPA: flagellar basal body rod C-terminal domain-containing protein [Phenylobacterium sp.]|jgi:flagellar basal body rod protein FlgC
MDPISTARYGMMAASRQLADSASRVANLAGDPGDYATEAVNVVEAKQAFSANVHVIKVADEMWQSLLSIQTDSHGR